MSHIGQVEISAIDGDITELEVDAILNSGNSLMMLGGSRSVAGRILSKTRGKVQRALDDGSKYPKPVPIGEIVVTEGFSLPCKYIFHLSTHGTTDQIARSGLDPEALLLKAISDGIQNAIRKAESMKCRSLAFPLIATGSLRLPMPLAIETHLNAISSTLESSTFLGLKQILVVTHNNPYHLSQLNQKIESLQHLQGGEFLFSRTLAPSESKRSPAVGITRLSIRHADSSAEADSTVQASLPPDWKLVLGRRRDETSPQEAKQLESELENARVEIRNLKEALRVSQEEIRRLSTDRTIPTDAPLPLAYAYSMVKAEIDPVLKMERLRRAIGIVLRYFASMVFADYHAKGCFDEATNQECREAFSKPVTDGTWFWAAVKVAEAYRQAKIEPIFVKEIPSLWVEKRKPFHSRCNAMIAFRNEIHDKISIDASTAEVSLGKVLPKWEQLFEAASSLMRYRLIYLEAVEDFGPNDDILYHIKWISGEHLVPKSEIVAWKEKLPRGRLYLWDVERGASLDLTPFMAYEYSAITKTKETYCIEQVIRGKIEFATLRFPHKQELPGYQGPIFTRHA